jgi:sugar/nucleoside kinase (ribokinase family)
MMEKIVISMGELVVEFFIENQEGSFSLIKGPYPSGAPAITIAALARLNVECGFIATVGHDYFGQILIDKLRSDGVDTSHVIVLDGVSTGMAFTQYDKHGERSFAYYISNEAPGRLSKRHVPIQYIRDAAWLHISGNVLAFSSATREAIYKAVDLAYAAGVPISLDPNYRKEMMDTDGTIKTLLPVLQKTRVLFPSEHEMNLITGMKDEKDAIEYLFQLGVQIIAKKRGKQGCEIFSPASHLISKGFMIDEIDPTGCGDSFCAGFIYGLLKGLGMEQTAVFANAVGALAATKKGAMSGADNISEVYALINKNKRNLE